MATDPALERRVLDLFQVVMGLPIDERIPWIESHSDLDSPLRTRLMALLAGDQLADLRTGGAAERVADDRIPERIGAYKIVARIGRGGMGAVYKGERDTGDFAHTAAIKLIKPGLLSERLIERFQRERQTLANLEHPNIARLYDGGETPEGAPYIVMEYVDGLPILDWAKDRELTRDERLALFGSVCEAVAHAHRNLIVHRDITPSNVLVTAEGAVKLIDFGIARATEAEGVGDAPSSVASLSLTPGFAAPERLLGSEATTAGDVYSLGKLLEALVAERRSAPELDAILRRATALDPNDRYPTVDAVRADSDALQQGLPVTAMGGGRAYLTRKFVQRHRFGVIAAGVAFALLLIAFAATAWSYVRAEAARTAEAQRFAQLRSLSGFMLFDLNERLRRVPGNAETRARLAAEAQKYLSGLAAVDTNDVALRLETANGLIELARVQGNPLEPNLAFVPEAIANLTKAETLLTALGPERAREPIIAAALIRALSYRALMELHGNTDAAASERYLRAAGARLDHLSKPIRHASALEARRLYRWARLEFFDLEERVPSLISEINTTESEIAEWQAILKKPRDVVFDRGLIAYYRGLSLYTPEQGDRGAQSFVAAGKFFESIDKAGPDDPRVMYMMGWTYFLASSAASALGKAPVSSDYAARANDVANRLLRIDDKDDATIVLARNAAETLSQDLANRGRFPEAIAAQRDVIAREKARLLRDGGGLGINLAYSEMVLGTIGKQAGDRTLACENWRTAQARYASVEKKGKILAFQKEYLKALRISVKSCDDGTAVSKLKVPR